MPASFFLNYKTPAMEKINFPRNSKCASHRTPYWNQFSLISLCEFQGSNSVPEAWQQAPNHLIGPISTNSKLYSEFCFETYQRPLTVFFRCYENDKVNRCNPLMGIWDVSLSNKKVDKRVRYLTAVSQLCPAFFVVWSECQYFRLCIIRRDTEQCC